MTSRYRTGKSAVSEWLQHCVSELANHSDRLNAINVFPVADSDTGSNLYRTARTALDRIHENPELEDVGKLLRTAGMAGLEGAHGNSGTLLAVMLIGMGERLDGVLNLTGPLLAEALNSARVRTWSALSEPVPGTMLSVLDAASSIAMEAAEPQAPDEPVLQVLGRVLEAVVAAARMATAQTQTQIQRLENAEVVDAGAVGMLIVLDCLACAMTGRVFDDALYEGLAGYSVDAPWITGQGEDEEGVEVMCTVTASPLQAASIRAGLDAVGTSVLMSPVGGIDQDDPRQEADHSDLRWRVHVHVRRAEEALDVVSATAQPGDVSVTSLSAHPDE